MVAETEINPDPLGYQMIARVSRVLLCLILATPAPAQDQWTSVVSGRPIAAGSAIVESAWTTTRPPGGAYDRIAVRRFAREAASGLRPVFLYLPGTNMNGQAALTDETHNLWIYLAARGVDVYTMDYRTATVPADPPADLSFMAGWTKGAFLEDIAAAVAFVREQSGQDRVFLGGFSRGVSLAYLYAARNWRTDLCGLVMLDGGLKDPHRPGTADLVKARAALEAGGAFASDLAGRTGWDGRQDLMRRAAADPPGPPTDERFADAAEQLSSVLYNAWGPGALANPVDGHSTPRVLATLLAGYDRFYPAIQEVEGRALAAFTDHPDLPYDDGLRDVAVPVIAFNGTGMGLSFLLSGIYTPSLLATKDVTIHVLEGWGHLDVIVGTRAAEQVFAPTLEWIRARQACTP
jgi:pimeloyl-ACP methyl ester carboxylesterase